MTDDAHVSEERAQLIWRRAAELQAEAARKLEARSRVLAPGKGDASDFSMTDVKSAAIEAGISPEFVELALAESNTVEEGKSHEAAERRARRFLGTDRASLEVSRVVNAPAASVLDALQRVLPSARYLLLHVDTLGDDPLKDGVYVFEPPSMWTQSGTAAEFASQMGSISAKRIYVSIRAIDEGRTEVAMRAPIARGLRINYRVGASLTGVLGVAGGLGGGAIVGGIAALAAGPLAIPAVAAGALLGTGGSGSFMWWVMRASFRHSVKKGEQALSTLLQVVDASARSRGAFALPEPPQASAGGLG